MKNRKMHITGFAPGSSGPVVMAHDTENCAKEGLCGSAWCMPHPQIDASRVKVGKVVDVLVDDTGLVTLPKASP